MSERSLGANCHGPVRRELHAVLAYLQGSLPGTVCSWGWPLEPRAIWGPARDDILASSAVFEQLLGMGGANLVEALDRASQGLVSGLTGTGFMPFITFTHLFL